MKLAKTLGPLLLAVLLFQLNGGMAGVLGQQTTGPPTTRKPPPPTETTQPGQVTGTVPDATEGTEVQATTTTHKPTTTTRKKRKGGALAHTGPGDDAGNFRLVLFNGGILMLMIGAIFFAVRRRVERRYWWNMSSRM